MGFEQDAAKVMKEEVAMCATMATRGTAGRVTTGALGAQAAGIAGAAGAAVAAMGASALNPKQETASSPGDHSGYVVLAAGKTRLGFFVMKRGLLNSSLGELLLERGRDEITRFAIDSKGFTTFAVDVKFNDGSAYGFELPRAWKGKAEKLQKELGF